MSENYGYAGQELVLPSSQIDSEAQPILARPLTLFKVEGASSSPALLLTVRVHSRLKEYGSQLELLTRMPSRVQELDDCDICRIPSIFRVSTGKSYSHTQSDGTENAWRLSADMKLGSNLGSFSYIDHGHFSPLIAELWEHFTRETKPFRGRHFYREKLGILTG